jgi:cytochrome c peroxidase
MPAKIRAEHEEEGIRNFENCVECHRDPGVEPQKSGKKRDSGSRKRD